MINAASSLVVLGAGHDDTVATPLYSCTRPRPPLRPSQPAPPTPASTASPTPTPNIRQSASDEGDRAVMRSSSRSA